MFVDIRSYKDEGSGFLGVTVAVFALCHHLPLPVTSRDCDRIPAGVTLEDAMTLAAHTEALLHGAGLTLHADHTSFL